MAESIVTGPDDQKYKVTHPEGATDAQIRAAAQRMSRQAEPVAAQDDGGFSFGEMVGNIPSSGARLGQNVWDAVTNPGQTLGAMGSLIKGGTQKAVDAMPTLPGDDRMMDPNLRQSLNADERPTAEAFGSAMEGRYGSVDNTLQTLEQDPVGMLADVAGVVFPFSPKMGAAINPINATMNAGKSIIKAATPARLPVRIYERVAKFGTTLTKAQRESMINTALRYGLAPTNKGVEKMAEIIRGLNGQIDDLIKTAGGKTIPRQSIYKYLKDLIQKSGGFKFEAADDLDAINKMVGNFEEYAKTNLPPNVTAAQLQAFKVNLYERINFDAKYRTGTPVKQDTYKTIARGSKEGVEQLAPGVKPQNQALSELYELQPHLQRSANRIENRRSIPLTAPIEMGAGATIGGALGGSSGAAIGGGAGGLAAFMGLPKVASQTAIGLSRLKGKSMIDLILKNNPNISAAELALILSGRTTVDSPLMPQQ